MWILAYDQDELPQTGMSGTFAPEGLDSFPEQHQPRDR